MAKLKVSVNKNPTKEGIKVQFVLPQTLEGDKKAEATQKLQSKLNQGLEQYNLTVSQDTDVPYANVIGFLIPIADIKLLIKNAIGGGSSEETPTEAAPAPEPAPEEPMKEIKRMQQLAGLHKEGDNTTRSEVEIDDSASNISQEKKSYIKGTRVKILPGNYFTDEAGIAGQTGIVTRSSKFSVIVKLDQPNTHQEYNVPKQFIEILK